MPTSTATRLRSRPEHPADAEFVRALFHDEKSAELAAAGLAPVALEQLVDLQFRARSTQYASTHPDAEGIVIELDGVPAGHALVARTASVVHLVDLAVLARHRRRGVASHLLRELVDAADASGQELRLEVRPGNTAARALYERFGFAAVGERNGDALLVRASAGVHAARGAANR